MWTKEKPTKKGSYWFYGNLFGVKRLEIINVLETSNKPLYVCCGEFVSCPNGVWWDQEIQKPELPIE